jgi:type II secretory ATPase GspE/PulE/Tfp pilus assembly ATPase PilB-like protein
MLTGKKQEWLTAVGCEVCHGIGYKGRVGIYEIFVMSPEVEQIILSGQVSEYDIEALAVKQGMVTSSRCPSSCICAALVSGRVLTKGHANW